MRHNFPSMRSFLKARDSNPDLLRFNLSPGGACGLLHVSRQRISQLISTPYLDAAVMDDGYVLLDYGQVLQRKRLMVRPKSRGLTMSR
jgi:hypothetical protein